MRSAGVLANKRVKASGHMSLMEIMPARREAGGARIIGLEDAYLGTSCTNRTRTQPMKESDEGQKA